MAHFAKIESGLVTQVIVVDNSDILDEDGNESEAIGVQYCKDLLGGDWVQTSYNKSFRKNYAGIGSTYDTTRNAFIHPKPYPSWVLNETTCTWEAPVARPSDDRSYVWDESSQSWS
jgi:hypothetical protein|tara:strand:- start:27 stop:374 length:348 start_codon:yes stop_codon:yes gene_type:complete